MSRLSRRALLASLALGPFATAAWAAKPEPVMAPRPHGPDEALIYIYRSWAFALGGREMMVRFNGVKSIKLGTEQYSWIYLKAGEYQVALTGTYEMGGLSSPKGLSERFEGGKTYFARIIMTGTGNRIVGVLAASTEQEAIPFIRGDFKRGADGFKLRPPLAETAELGATDR